ncbi:hypothetical protein [Bacillus cereus group sp. MYBK14-1]|uniref:hypothetical protein n=1 Tax=Bacillus cereus group sp. MYBK14-1 TaxID=3450682 RepID=UPI003F7B0A6A
MAHFDFEVEFRTNEIGPSGNQIITFGLVACISHPVRGELLYPMTAKYTDGMVLHDMDTLKRDFSHVQLRRDLITSMKEFVKSQVE